MLNNTRRTRIPSGAIFLTVFAMRELMDYYNNWRHARRSVEEFYPEEERSDVSQALDKVVRQMLKTSPKL